MSFFLMKSILASIFLLAALVAVICMLNLMGKTERKIKANVLRKMHKGAGFTFAVLLVVISYFCIKYWITAGDQISTRAVLHGFLSLALIVVLSLKLSIVRFYKQFLRFVPVMGMTVFSLGFVVFSTSAGYFFLRSLVIKAETSEVSVPAQLKPKGDIKRGSAIFVNKCNSCHYADKEDRKSGPGLKNLLKKEKLPSSGRAATAENIKKQLLNPFLAMPSFGSLAEQELADLLAYLETL